MRVTFLTHYFPPEVGAPQARISALARALAARGARVTVHTCFPHYPDGRILAPYRNRPWLVEQDGAIRVVRSAVYPAANRGFARRLANHASFGLSALAGARVAGPADVVVVESPPLFTAAAGLAYARLKEAPLVMNVADRWPASAVELGALSDRRAIRAAEWLERSCYRAAAAIAAPTDGIAEALAGLPEARGKVAKLGPAVDVERFRPAAHAVHAERLRVLYAGTIGLAQGLDTLIDAAAIAGPDTVEVAIAGSGAEAGDIERRIAERGAEHVRLLGVVRHGEVPALYAGADAAVVLLRDRPIFRGALPTKMLEAMAAGVPLVLSAEGEAARLVRETGAGVVVPPEDPEALAAALVGLALDPQGRRSMGEAGRRCAVERFSRAASAAQWAELLERVAARRPVPA